MRLIRLIYLTVCASVLPMFAQLAIEQKEHDFRNLAALYAKRYAPAAWKKQLFGVDVLNIKPWLERVRASKDDLEFLEICMEYVASLDDLHVSFSMTSNFRADAGLRVDIYDGKVLIEAVNTATLPPAQFPIRVGDELLAVDGKSVDEWIAAFSKLSAFANPITTRRFASGQIVFRSQAIVPTLPNLPDESTFQILHQTGVTASYKIPWTKTGVPVLKMGPAPTPEANANKESVSAVRAASVGDEEAPAYMKAYLDGQNAYSARAMDQGVLGVGSRAPIWAIPGNFTIRRGLLAADTFFSANYTVGSRRIGYIRIPSFSPASTAAALAEFASEIAFFEANTDGLVVDVTRNPGGSCGYMALLASYLHPSNFTVPMFEARVTAGLISAYDNSLQAARLSGAARWIIDHYEHQLGVLRRAYDEGRGMTGPLPRCAVSNVNLPATNANGSLAAYTKPLITLVDEISISSADFFAAVIQDNRRGPLVGVRTSGAGGTVNSFPTGFFSEATASVTESLLVRRDNVRNPGYPVAPYIENIGVHPEIYLDYMTRANLLNRGLTYVQDFTGAIIREINRAAGGN